MTPRVTGGRDHEVAGSGEVDLDVVRDQQDPQAVETLLRSLPDWFGIDRAIVGYVDDARRLPTYLAVQDGAVVGALLLSRHFPVAAEVHLMAVEPSRHRRGIGRALLEAAEADLRAGGTRWLQVKTLGPSRPSAAYAATRAFYEACGFEPLRRSSGSGKGTRA